MNCGSCNTENFDDATYCGNCGAALNEVISSSKRVTLGLAIQLGFSRYIVFGGRSNRAEFWWWALFIFVSQLFLIPFGVLGPLFELLTLIPSIAVGSRRLHDINKTGWWQLVYIVPFVGLVIMFLFAMRRGDPGLNHYGHPPSFDSYE